MGLERKLHKQKIEPQKIVVIFFGVFTGFALWAIFDRPLEDQVNENLDQLEINNSGSYLDYPAYDFKSAKKILFYTPRYGIPDWNMGSGNEPFQRQYGITGYGVSSLGHSDGFATYNPVLVANLQ